MTLRARSASTQLADPYRAGVALGEALRPIAPEVVFLFSSIHYAAPELLEGLYDALENDDVLVVGNSADGCFETGGAFDHGVAALALDSGGEIRWRVEYAEGIGERPDARLGDCLAGLSADGETPSLGILLSDYRVDAGLLEKVLRNSVHFPVIGGLAMDDRQWRRSVQYANRRVLENAAVLLAAYGPLRFSIHLGNSQRPIGRAARVDAADANRILTIDGIGGTEFIERETGRPLLQTDRGILALRIRDSEHEAEERLRTVRIDADTAPGPLTLYGGVTPGSWLQTCEAHPDDMIAEVRAIAETVRAGDGEPAAALIVSCTGRKARLGPLAENDITALTAAFPQGLPAVGFPSSGEFAPVPMASGYTRNLLHNMTYVLLVLERPT